MIRIHTIPPLRTLGAALLFFTTLAASAQELVRPLHASPRGNALRQLKADGLNEVFLYQNEVQTLPVIDDFSVDRTRHLNAASDDPGVSLTETIYKIEVGGVSTPDMAFRTEPGFHYTIDQQPDTLIVTQDTLPKITAIVRDLSSYPVSEQSMFLWPLYTLIDTVGDTDTDTLALEPQLVQDSLLVYTVAADGRTYTNPDNSARPWILWADDDAYINGTYPLDPPSIGVATMDGMDRTGYPYQPEAPNTNGLADHLTSVPIQLAFPASDSIWLSFFHEPVGLSGDNINHPEDSLRLEFYAPGSNSWHPVWSIPGPSPGDPYMFRQTMVPIKDGQYLVDGFRFRFSNDATLGGAVDQWHIDYVRLDRNRNASDTVLQDVAWLYPEAGLLNRFTSVPFAKFIQAPSSYMANSVDLVQRNNDTQDKFITWGYGAASDCGWSADRDSYGNNISNNAQTTFNTVHPVNTGADPLVYDLDGCPDAAFVTAKFWTNATPDGCAWNDTMTYRQEVSNYYSYDDGTAEAGYSIGEGAGSKIAYRFDTQGADSLRALRLYFDPIFTYDGPPNNPADGGFIITVWSSLAPEQIIYQNVSFSSPHYRLDGPDHFVEYPLDSTIAVNGTFYVGWVQTNDVELQLGLDRNRDNHDMMYYNLGQGWNNSSQQGSWMIRPVVVAPVDPFASIPEQALSAEALRPFPVPADRSFRLEEAPAGMVRLRMLSAMGAEVRSWDRLNAPFDVAELSPGLYLLQALAADGRALAHGRILVQH
jgi:hypothetical protein